MFKELELKTAELFTTADKWVSYLEFTTQAEIVKGKWLLKCKSALIKHFQENPIDGWSFNENSMNWYLTEFGSNSLSIWLEQYSKFSLWVSGAAFDSPQISALLDTPYFSSLLSVFTRIDESSRGHYKIIEQGNFIFDSPYDGNFGENTIAWYAGNRTGELVAQIMEKVDRIRENPERTKLLIEINEQTQLNR